MFERIQLKGTPREQPSQAAQLIISVVIAQPNPLHPVLYCRLQIIQWMCSGSAATVGNDRCLKGAVKGDPKQTSIMDSMVNYYCCYYSA